jgi:hypothetical protein
MANIKWLEWLFDTSSGEGANWCKPELAGITLVVFMMKFHLQREIFLFIE